MHFIIVNIAILIYALQNSSVYACIGEPLAQTGYGKVRGAKQIGSEGDEFCAFKGIPYAKPPVGELRFQDPEPPEPWSTVLETTAYGPMCAQHDWLISKVVGVEDCLYLNVYTKSVEPKIKRPVMVWIHGGGFTCGSGDDLLYGPDYFMSKDIVLVAMNYRLGIFGFLNLDGTAGNQGMKDQVMALQWVRDNIANFGGDPDNITIFGESAGGASVHYHAISPLSKGLFHKAISQSGVAINPWVLHTTATIKEQTLRLCESLGHTDQNLESVIQFLKTADAQKITKAQKTLLTKEERIQGTFTFGPSIDFKSKNPFLPVHPREAATAGIQVPLMIGHNTREGVVTAGDRFNSEFAELLHPDIINIIKLYGLTMEDLKKMYFQNDPITKKNMDVLMNLYGDIYFIEGVHKALKTQIEKSSFPTYYYQFTYDKGISIMKILFNTQMSGSSHADDLFFMFRATSLLSKLKVAEKGSDRYRILEQMIEMWVNFATTGKPIPEPSELLPLEWNPISNGTVFPFMNICENLRMESVTNMEQKLIAH